MSIRLTSLRQEFNSIQSGIETIERAATDAGRDLTDTEQADVDQLFARAAIIKPEIEAEVAKAESMSSVAGILAKVNAAPATVNRAAAAPAVGKDLTAGQYFSHVAALRQGEISPQEFNRATQVVADAGTALPEPILNKLIDFIDPSRPVFASFTANAMPGEGETFRVPRVTQHVSVTEQAAEFDTLASQKMILTSDSVSKSTIGGYLDLSEQNIRWTSPAALDLAIDSFIKQYAIRTEIMACAYLSTTAGASVGYTATNVGTIVTSFVNGAKAVLNSAKEVPNTLWVGVDAWGALAGTTNTGNDRTALSMVREALGEFGVSNLSVVLAPRLAADTRILGVRSTIHQFENRYGLLKVGMPEVLGQRIAYAGEVAFYGRTEGLVKLV